MSITTLLGMCLSVHLSNFLITQREKGGQKFDENVLVLNTGCYHTENIVIQKSSTSYSDPYSYYITIFIVVDLTKKSMQLCWNEKRLNKKELISRPFCWDTSGKVCTYLKLRGPQPTEKEMKQYIVVTNFHKKKKTLTATEQSHLFLI